MSQLAPPDVALPDTAADDPRLGTLLGRAVEHPEEARVVIVGFPSDEGVRINGGRPGAAEAPDAIRRALYTLTPDARCFDRFTDLLSHTVDLGNLKMTGTLEANQRQLGKALGPYLKQGALPLVLGGGHETAFGHFLGYVEAERPVAILNWDAHADVRPLKDGRPHSGSPFRQALEHSSGVCQSYTVAGLQPHSAARAHIDYLDAKGADYLWNEEVSCNMINALYAGASTACMATFDLDGVDQSAAPGVSAPAVGGLDPKLWWHAAYRAGRTPSVTSMDIVELNPRVDVDHRTARVAALTVWHFLRGLVRRQ